MPKPRAGARLKFWRGDWYLFYRDDAAGGIERRRMCSELGATNAASRRKLVKEYQTKEQLMQAERTRRGGVLAFDTPLIGALEDYISEVNEREKVREANPDSRQGLTKDSAKQARFTVGSFIEWLRNTGQSDLTTGELEAATLRRFFDFLAVSKTKRGNLPTTRRAATMNKHKRYLRAALNKIDQRRPPRFPDIQPLVLATKEKAGETYPPKSFSSHELARFLKAAIDLEGENHPAAFLGRRVGAAASGETKRVATPQTPVSALFLLLALTGCRLDEALNMRWDQVDVEEGVLRFRRTKTGPYRYFHLLYAPECVVAREFVRLLMVWRELAKRSATKAQGYVLPHGTQSRPSIVRAQWEVVDDHAGRPGVGPQALRQNFVSYGASLNVPSSVVAMWAGHSAQVAEKHYRTPVRNRVRAENFEEAMGLTPVIRDLIQLIGKLTHVWPPGVR